MFGKPHLRRYIAKFIISSLPAFLLGCTLAEVSDCLLPCQLGVDQTNPLFVQDFLNTLLEHGWIQDGPERTFQAMYAPDTFSNVLETTTFIALDGDSPEIYGSEIDLYIGNVGTVELDNEAVPSEQIEAIKIDTNIPIPISWLLYGLPNGGEVLPFYLASDLSETNPCPNRSHYIAYYHGGRTIIRAVVARPILINLWVTPVEIVFPIDEVLEFSSSWIGRFDTMDHTPCMPN